MAKSHFVRIKEPYMVRLTIVLSPEIDKKLKKLTGKNQMAINQIINELIKRELKRLQRAPSRH